MTLNDWAYGLSNIINPLLADDEEVNLRQIKNWILDARALFLKNNLESQKQLEYNISQTLPNLDLEYVSTGVSGFKTWKTVKTIPNIIMLDSTGPAIVRLGSEDFTEPGWKIHKNLAAVSFAGNGRFNEYQIFGYLNNDFIYFKSKDPLFPLNINNKVFLTAVFSDVRDLEGFNNSDGKPVYSDQHTDFPANRHMKTYIENMILKERFGITEKSNPDKKNDGTDNSDTPQRNAR